MSRLKFAIAAIVLSLLTIEAMRQVQKPRLLGESRAKTITATLSPSTKRDERSQASWFTDISDEIKLDFIQAAGPFGTHFMPEINGSGGALFDYDNDSDLDLFLVNLGKSPKATHDFPPEVNLSHRLYRQEPDGVFSDQTINAGLSNIHRNQDPPLGIGCAIGDVNNDGYSDIYITNYGPDQLFINRHGEHFVDSTDVAGLGCGDWGTASAFFDYDRDGWLDLIVVNYCSDPRFGHSIACGFTDGTVSYCGPQKFEATIDRLYHNNGLESLREGVPTFTDVTASAGLDSQTTYGLGLAIGDFDGNKWPDIFVANDMGENRLWMNQGDGTFRDEALVRGVARSGEGMIQGCMGVTCADVDHDSDFDLLVTNLVTEGATLYENNGQGVFVDKSQATGVDRLTKRHTGWGVAWVDLDLDGFLDLPMVNGFVVPNGSMFPPHGEDKFQNKLVEVTHGEAFIGRYYDKNQVLMNSGNGDFTDQSIHAGDFFRMDGSNRALIYGDVDEDGDIDLITTSVGGRARLFRNDIPRLGHWLKLDCRLPGSGRLAIGTIVHIHSEKRSWTGQLTPSTSYLASNDPCIHFGLGGVARIERIEVNWPDGSSEFFHGTDADRRLSLVQGTGIQNSHD